MDDCNEKLNPNNEKQVPQLNFWKHHFKHITAKFIVNKPLMNFVDTIISLFLVGPMSVTFWRGTWGIMDTYGRFFPYWSTCIFAWALLIFFNIIREIGFDIVNCYRSSKKPTLHTQCLRRIYTYSFAWISIMNWRSLWGIYDNFCSITFNNYGFVVYNDNIGIIFIMTVILLIILMLIKCVRNNIAVPFIIVLDYQDLTFMFPSRFRFDVSMFIAIKKIVVREFHNTNVTGHWATM